VNPDYTSQEKRWSIFAGVALVLMVLIVAFDLLVPKPKAPLTDAQHQIDVDKKTNEALSEKVLLAQARKDNQRFLWSMPVDKIGPTALSAVNELARVHQVTITAFRPQKQNEQSGLLLLPYLIVMQGTYPGVTGFLHDLQATSTKLAVNLVQVAAADQSTDQVNASIGVIAYTTPPEPPATPAPATSSTSKSTSAPVTRPTKIVNINGRTKKS